jgi:tetratricopeptide (TPR) repeat protein/tRNA A-37 threonylcarbamoyl transferase component Bud32
MMSFLGVEAESDPIAPLSTEDLVSDGSASTFHDDRPGCGVDTSGSAPSVRIPGYELVGELGRGGMGVVYRARQVRLNRPCALKMILAGSHATTDTSARFLAEAEAIARLQHPHIVQIHHIGEADGLPFFELEYLPGGSLDRQLDGTPWEPKRAARLADQLALGIAEAHRSGVVHRDLKPANVLLAADGTPKISDFGLAKTLGSEAGLTRSEAIMGSPTYMAPEQAEGRAKSVGPAADIYALGVILYELLTGRPPFRDAAIWETLEQVKTVEPVPPSRLVPKLPRDLETICLKCLQKEPSRRYATADALADDLRRFLEHRPVQARPIPAWERAARWARRRPVHAALVSVVVVALASLIGGGLWYNGRLRAALGDAESRRREANLQRQRAETNFQKARTAVDEMLTQVGQEELADIPRMGPVRERLLNKALAFYQGFLGENSDDPAIRKELARAYGRIGDIQAMLHRVPEAEAAYGQAIALSSPPIVPSPDSADRSDLARFYGELGSLLMQAGRSREATDSLDRSTELLESLGAEFPGDPAHKRELARVEFTRGRLLLGLSDVEGARRAYARSVTLGDWLVARHPDVAEYRFELARCLASLGLIMSDFPESDRHYLRGIDLLETLTRDNPDVARYRSQLGRTLLNWGTRLHVKGKLRDAESCYRRLTAIYERLAADFPDRPDYRHHLSMGYNNLGEQLAGTGDPAAAERSFRASLELKRGLANANPDVPDYRNGLGTGLAALGQHLADQNRLSEGRALLEEAIRQHRAALAKVPRHAVYRREAHQTCEFLGTVLNRLGDHAGLARLASQLSPNPSGEAIDDRLAACVLARGILLALADGSLPSAVRQERARQYGDSAMAALREAIRKGDRDFRYFRSNPDLAPLLIRNDFVQLVMDPAFPADPFAR